MPGVSQKFETVEANSPSLQHGCPKGACDLTHHHTQSCFSVWLKTEDAQRVVQSFIGHSRENIGRMIRHLPDTRSSRLDMLWDDPQQFGEGLYRIISSPQWARAGKSMQLALDNGWIAFNHEREVFEMQHVTEDLTTLMWQVALTNWETTRRELTTAQVATMAQISLQALFTAALPNSTRDFDPDQVDKAMSKTQTVVSELVSRMRAEKTKKLRGGE